MRSYLKSFCLFITLVCVLSSVIRANTIVDTRLKVLALRCDQLINPAIVEAAHPALSWQMISTGHGKVQSAYRVIVSGSAALLAQNKGDLWDSGKVPSANSTQVVYQGKALSSRQKAYWKVMVWDERGRPSAWSSLASWQMGLLQPSDWQAKWIGAMENPTPELTKTYPAPYFRKNFTATKKVK